jgi:hypothetical protein
MLLDFSEAIFFTCKVKDSSADLPVFVSASLGFVSAPQTFYLPPSIG